MFIRDYKQSGGGTYFIYAWGGEACSEESPAYSNVNDLAEGLKKDIDSEFKGTIPVTWEAPLFLRQAVEQAASELPNGEIPTFTYRQIDIEDRKRINDSLGIKLTLE